MQTAKPTDATKPVAAEPPILRKRVGSTLFEVTIRFSETSKETMQDKVLRLIEREASSHD